MKKKIFIKSKLPSQCCKMAAKCYNSLDTNFIKRPKKFWTKFAKSCNSAKAKSPICRAQRMKYILTRKHTAKTFGRFWLDAKYKPREQNFHEILTQNWFQVWIWMIFRPLTFSSSFFNFGSQTNKLCLSSYYLFLTCCDFIEKVFSSLE
jgi:hypothetical protein